MENFGEDYASLYDLFYESKDNASECDHILRQLEIDGSSSTGNAILDLGCGAGRHAIELARRGYRVTGVDRSEAMIQRAQQKASHLPSSERPEFHVADIRNLKLDQTYDAAIMMFAVFGYQTSDADAISTLQSIRKRLRPGSRLVFDVWHGPGVLKQKPEPRTNKYTTPQGEVTRRATPTLDLIRQICRIDYEIQIEPDDTAPREVTETHEMRFFFPREMGLLLAAADFEMTSLLPFPELESPLDENAWHVLTTATAR